MGECGFGEGGDGAGGDGVGGREVYVTYSTWAGVLQKQVRI